MPDLQSTTDTPKALRNKDRINRFAQADKRVVTPFLIADMKSRKSYAEEKSIPLAAKQEEDLIAPKFQESERFLIAGLPKWKRYQIKSLRKNLAHSKKSYLSEKAGNHRHKSERLEITGKQIIDTYHRLFYCLVEAEDTWRGHYQKHIASPEWRAFRLRIKAERGNTCEECRANGDKQQLHVHHLTYVRIGRERGADVKLLCQQCHAKKHDHLS